MSSFASPSEYAEARASRRAVAEHDPVRGARTEEWFDGCGEVGVVELACDVREDRAGGDQVPVSWERREVVPREVVDFGACAVMVAGLNVSPCERRSPCRDRGDLAYEPLEVRGELAEPELLVSELQHLDAVGLKCVYGARALPESEHLAGGPLALVPAALEQRPHGAQRGGVHEQLRLSEVGGEDGEAVDVLVCLLEATMVEEGDRAPDPRARFDAGVAEPLAGRGEVVGQLEPGCIAPGMPVGVLSGGERLGERLGVVQASCHVDGAMHEVVEERNGCAEVIVGIAETREHAGSQRGVLGGQAAQCLFEQVGALPIGHAEPLEAAA